MNLLLPIIVAIQGSNIGYHRAKEYVDTNKVSCNVPKCEFMLVEIYQSLAKLMMSL